MPIKDKEERRKYHREWKAKRRANYFSDKRCIRCNSAKNLQLHHINPKEKEHHSIWSWSEKRRTIELKKCEVLCQKCHWAHHAKLRRPPVEHGTRSTYVTYRCRCLACRKANADYAYYRKQIQKLAQAHNS